MSDESSFRHRLPRLNHESPNVVVAYELSGSPVTARQLFDAADAVRSQLTSGHRVGVLAVNSVEGLAALHGVWMAGCSAVLISTLTPAAEAERRLQAARVSATVTPGSPAVVQPTGGDAADTNEAVVIFTSGTTGVAKAASIPFRALQSSVRTIGQGLGLPPEGRALTDPPRAPTAIFVSIAHMGGLLATQSAWSAGKPILLVPKFDAELAFELVNRFDLSALSLTPAMVFDMAHAPGHRSLGGVKTVSVGTAALPENTRQDFEKRFGVAVLRNYGQTEFTGAIAFERYEDVKAGRRPSMSVGRVAQGVEVRIVNEAGQEVQFGEVGEIWARGGSAMAGYLGQDGEPSHTGTDGWVVTGDLGTVDAEGFLTVVGRARDIVICGGFNIYPAVVEAAINELPGIVDSAVVGLPDERLGEIPVVAVVAGADANLELDELRTSLRQKVAPYELPRQLRIVASIPRTANGKVDRPSVVALFS